MLCINKRPNLSRTDDNRITMITCITGKPDLRLMVQAKEI